MTFNVTVTPELTVGLAATAERTASLASTAERTASVAIAVQPFNLDAPSNLAVETLSTSQLRLTWTDNSSEEDGFSIERSDDGLTGWAEQGTVATGVETWDDSGLAAGTTYYYRVRAYHD